MTRESGSRWASTERELASTNFGVFVLTPDDTTHSRSSTKRASPRDNVIFELGLFAGKLGLHRTFIVHPRGLALKIPSDLAGITMATYEPSVNLIASLGAACTQIRLQITSRQVEGQLIGWNEFCDWIKALARMLRASPRLGGFSFDAVVGISRGGLTVADLLSRQFGGTIPVLSLWADRHTNYPTTIFAPPENWINQHVLQALANDRIKNILVVDDITGTGTTVVKAKEFLLHGLPGRRIKSAVLIAEPAIADRLDYCVTRRPTAALRTPFSALD